MILRISILAALTVVISITTQAHAGQFIGNIRSGSGCERNGIMIRDGLDRDPFDRLFGSGTDSTCWMWLAGYATPSSHYRTVIRTTDGATSAVDVVIVDQGDFLVFLVGGEGGAADEDVRSLAAFKGRAKRSGNRRMAVLAGVYSADHPL
jgi:hypothetical protein